MHFFVGGGGEGARGGGGEVMLGKCELTVILLSVVLG